MKRENIDATIVKSWKKSKKVSQELKDQIDKMNAVQLKQAFNKKPLAFGTAGIRAKMGPGTQYLNEFVYRQIMIGYCKFVLKRKKHPKIMIAHDNRRHSQDFALACADVATKMGVDVYLPEDNKLLPTPILSYAIRKYKLDGGVNITASHNPKEDNGFKAYNHKGGQVMPNDANIIIKSLPPSKDILCLEKYLKSKHQGDIKFLKYYPLVDDFFETIIKKVNIDKTFLLPRAPIKKMPIVFTGFHGTTTELVPRMLRQLGFKKVYVYPHHSNISGEFEDCPTSNPEEPRAFNNVIRFATKVKATLIIGCDPDGDRMALVCKKTNRWRPLNGNEMGIIFTHYILNRRQFPKTKPTIITTHVSTGISDRIAKKYNAQVIKTKTGFKWMVDQMDKLNSKQSFVIAFEEAIGALVHDACRDKDAFGAILLALEIYDQGNAYFADLHDYLCDRLYGLYGATFTQTMSYTIKTNNWAKDAKILMSRAKHWKDKKIFDYQIKKIWYENDSDSIVWTLDKDSWIKFRLSGTEPKFKVYLNLNNQMPGQLKASATVNKTKIEKGILHGFNWGSNYGQ